MMSSNNIINLAKGQGRSDGRVTGYFDPWRKVERGLRGSKIFSSTRGATDDSTPKEDLTITPSSSVAIFYVEDGHFTLNCTSSHTNAENNNSITWELPLLNFAELRDYDVTHFPFPHL